ncbi:MAG: FliI/YscN family ATPase [Gammaproteobacteria bacterium]|nr:FliI/YscN family ATPase [Gammaproteobacteria bacterium]
MERLLTAVKTTDFVRRTGKVSQFVGSVIESVGPDVFVGELCEIHSRAVGRPVYAEVMGLREGRVLMTPYEEPRGISLGAEVVATGRSVYMPVGGQLLGRVIDAFGTPLDGQPAPLFTERYPIYPEPINPLRRTRISQVLETGVRTIDSLLTVGRGQRVGIFSGSGVGKSTLLGMIARSMNADVNVIALVGERGREVRDFIEDILGPEGLARSVVIVATSDQPALVRMRAALAATTIAEYFRNRGKDVVLTMDSITRFAMASREIGLSIGEPPTARGYTPSVFAALPRLLERGGACDGGGSITAFYTILVEGDDMNDPIADAVRSILDGHIVLSRALANRGHYPAIEVLTSISRLFPDLANADEKALAKQTIKLLSVYYNSKDLIDVGAYRSGLNPEVDKAIRLMPALEKFLTQEPSAPVARAQAYNDLRGLLTGEQ